MYFQSLANYMGGGFSGALRGDPYNFGQNPKNYPKFRIFIFLPDLDFFLGAGTPPSNPKFCVDFRNNRFGPHYFLRPYQGPQNVGPTPPPRVKRPRKGGLRGN